MAPSRIQVPLKSLMLVVAAAAVGLALAPRDEPYWGLMLPAALVAGWALPRAAPAVASALLGVFALVEVVLHFPVAAWIYAPLAVGIGASAWPRAESPHRRRRFAAVGLACLVAATLYWTPWSSRKPFLHALDGIRPGMSMEEVRRRMAGYKTGAGFALPGQDGEFRIHGSIIFRHSDDPEFNADWGIVSFREGLVANVDFSAD